MEAIPLDLTSSNPREIALAVLFHLHERDVEATDLLHELLRRGKVRGPDARLATELALGILRQRSRLDAIVEPMTRRPWKRTPPLVRDVLRLGAYQLLFMHRIPDHAAVNESVELARRWATPGHAAMVNAILRRVAHERGKRREAGGGREEARGERPEVRDGKREAGDEYPPKADWPVVYSHPPWLVHYFLQHYPAEGVAALLEWNNRAPALMLRANRLRTTTEALAERLRSDGYEVAQVGRPTPESLTLAGTLGDLGSAGWLTEGLATVQDGAAQLIAHFLAPQPGDRIVDWCAAPGGKSTHLAELTDDSATVLALDVDADRLSQVAIQAERLGLKSIRAHALRPELIEWLEKEPADAVLVDAPCTGLGTIQRHPDIRWRRRLKNLERSARLQLEILDAAARCVAPGGRLVYSTCTLGPIENEQVVEKFLARHPQFQRGAQAGGSYLAVVQPFLDDRGDLRTWPPEHGIDGFYAARLIRTR
jgi:16S rRNA (cytosine967-C5)-methyltransferase